MWKYEGQRTLVSVAGGWVAAGLCCCFTRCKCIHDSIVAIQCLQAYYLRRRDTLRALASDLEIAEEAVCATVMKQLFEGLSVSVQHNLEACQGACRNSYTI